MAHTRSDQPFLDRARNGDQNAFRELVERHKLSVARTVSGMLGNDPDVDDVVQEVFIRFYQTLDRFRGDATCKTYLTRIAINRSLDILRRRKRRSIMFLSRDHASSYPEPQIEDTQFDRFDRIQLIQSAISRLKPHHRAVIVLRLIDGYSTSEAAKILNIAEGTVLSRLSRATAHLRDIISPVLEQEM